MYKIILFAFISFCAAIVQKNPTFETYDDLVIALKYTKPDAITDILNVYLIEVSDLDHKNYGNYMSVDEINSLVELFVDSYKKSQIINYLKSIDIHCIDNIDSISCTTFKEIDQQFIDHLLNSYKDTILFIEVKSFISNYKKEIKFSQKINYDQKSDNSVDPNSITEEVVMQLYGGYPTFIDPTVSIGAIEFMGQDGFLNSDLEKAQVANGVPKNKITKNHTIGQISYTDIESSLDTQTIYWFASNGQLWYEVYNSWMFGWASFFSKRKEIPNVVSLSWGWSELDQCNIVTCNNISSKEYVDRTNLEFIKILLRGTTIVAASGDDGSPGKTNIICHSEFKDGYWNNINAVFPGSSPYITSVGATYLVKTDAKFNYQSPICNGLTMYNCSSGTLQEGTTLDKVRWTSGSGFTHWDKTPKWQEKEVKEYLNSGVTLPDNKYFNREGRGYPDVSVIGHNCLTLIQGGWMNIDGTSCSSPVFASIVANLNSFQKSRGKPLLGFINPLLYKMNREFPNSFNDLTVGNTTCTTVYCGGRNFGFIASNGWDAATGLGSPNIEQMKKFLSQY